MSADQQVIYEISAAPGLCHCSSLARTHAGGLFCVWYEGAYEGAPDTAIRGAARPPGARRWEPARDLLRYPGTPLGNPVLFRLSAGPAGAAAPDAAGAGREGLHLLFSVLLGESWSESVLYVCHSRDDGASWSNPELLFPRKGLMAKTRPLQLASGRILVPLYDEAGYYPVVLVVEDPKHWCDGRLSAETMARGIAIQPALAECPDGSLVMFCRSARGRIWKSLSYNGGLSWSLCSPTRLPNPDSAVELLGLDRQSLLLAFNNSGKDRRSLSVALSRDAGQSWSCLAEIDGGAGEYSYPSLLADGSGLVHLAYTENRYRIKHFQFDLGWLEQHRLAEPLPTD